MNQYKIVTKLSFSHDIQMMLVSLLGSCWVLFVIILGSFENVLGSFWDRSGIVLGSLWNHFGIIWGSFWDRAGIIFESFLDHVGITLGSFWDHFWII